MSTAGSSSVEVAKIGVKGAGVDANGRVRVGVDTGGTFTDLIVYDQARDVISIAKTLTTKPDPSLGTFHAIEKAGLDPASIEILVHGTTAATNTLIERNGAT